MSYDPNNIFARILRKEIPCRSVDESTHSFAFYDIHPKVPLHVLIIPKGPYINADDFFNHATVEELVDFTRFLGSLPEKLGTQEGYQLVSHAGVKSAQEVPHFHIHLLGTL